MQRSVGICCSNACEGEPTRAGRTNASTHVHGCKHEENGHVFVCAEIAVPEFVEPFLVLDLSVAVDVGVLDKRVQFVLHRHSIVQRERFGVQ